MDIREKVKKLPLSSGVYIMKDSLGTTIYVGKSKNLKSRVGSYFMNSKTRSPKVIKLLKNLKDFEYILTDTEFEALLLECRLIKEIKPRYNRQMKTPKGYRYIRIKMNEKYPSIDMCIETNNDDNNLYFGPYTSKNTVEKAILGIKEHNKILCTNAARKISGCLKYSMNLCIGMCENEAFKEYYDGVISKVIKMLNGTDLTILKEIEERMEKASENLDFEAAVKCRDDIKAIKYLIDGTKIINFIKNNINIAFIEILNDKEIKLFLIRYNKVIFTEKYEISKLNVYEVKLKIKKYFNNSLKQIINIDKNDIDEIHIIYNYLKSKDSVGKYMVILNDWLDNLEDLSFDKAIKEFIKIKE
ncbi:GIY-YIG nuclease family protein [Clostridium felsineum]|uniref:UvrB/UvrC motif-containing protein n=1 Tax=Clostridium felsineum TaxID=36839 RepID=UPI00214D804D|nr:UvrB/UvrC motif-containing protein [Clostridium felsineum]MCR3759420.1 GIY-YIG nuclease family protein [Clostridium felsineum]